MLLPLVSNKRVYDGIVEGDIIGIKISPCENFIAIVSYNSVQIVSNRRNRVLVARKYLDREVIGEKDETVSFNGKIQWSRNSQIIVLGASSNKHVLIYNLNLTSPLDFSSENDRFKSDFTSPTYEEDKDDYSDTASRNGDDFKIKNSWSSKNGGGLGNADTYIKDNTMNCSGIELGNSEFKSNNSDRKFFFLTEEIENGLIKVPSINVPDELIDKFEDELLSFQLLNEFGTVVNKNKLGYTGFSETGENETQDSDKKIEFSTSFCKICLNKVVNLYYNYSSFELIYDNNIMDYVLLFALYRYPILVLTPVSNPNKRRNILLNEFVTFKELNLQINGVSGNYNQINDEERGLNLNLSEKKRESVSFNFCSNSLLPVLSPSFTQGNCISSLLLESVQGDLNREIKLDNMKREFTSNYINDALKARNGTFFPSSKFECNNYQSIIDHLIYENSKYGIKDYNFEGDMYTNIEASCVSYNISLDWISLLIRPWNSLLLFSWRNSFSSTIPGDCLSQNLDSELNSKSDDMLIGLILKANGVIEYSVVEKNNQPLIVSITNTCLVDYESELFSGMNKIEHVIHSENDYDCHRDSNHRNKCDFDYEKEDNNYLIEIFTLIRDSINVNIECVFSLELSKVIEGLTNKILSDTINLEVICDSNFIILTLNKDGIMAIDILTGKVTFTIGLCNKNKRLNNCNIKSDNINSNIYHDKSNSLSDCLVTIINSKMISSDFGLLIQIKGHDHENCDAINSQLIEIPIYKLITSNSTICSLENEHNRISCENLVFIGTDNIRIAQCNSRNLNLEFNSENLNEEDFSLNCNSVLIPSDEFKRSVRAINDLSYYNCDKSNLTHKNKVDHCNSRSVCNVSDDSDAILSSFNVFTGELSLESIQTPPSIYINHNWSIKEAYLNKSGNYLLISGFRACAIFDITNSRWRLFCDVVHELLLCKPNLPFGWVTDYLLFLVVDSSLLLTTFHDLITSSDDLWEMSVFEKNLMYEKYTSNLEDRLNINNKSNENNCDLCIVFFDIRNSLDIKNVVGIIPFCSTPILIVNSKKDVNNSFIVYYKNYSLICYESDSENKESAPTKTKWLIDLSLEWVCHPIDMLLIQENSNLAVILVLNSSYRLFKLVIFHGNLENSLNKKCKYHLESLIPDNTPFSIKYEGIDDDTVYISKSNFETYNFNKILKFGYYSISKYDFQVKKVKDESEDNPVINADNLIGELTSNFDAIFKLLKNEYKLIENFDVKNIIFNNNLMDYLIDRLGNKVCSSEFTDNDELKSSFHNNTDSNISGLIWYITQDSNIFVLPVNFDECSFNENYNDHLVKANKKKKAPILVKSFNFNCNLVYLVNFIPQLGSLLVLESNSNIHIKEVNENGISLVNEFSKNLFRIKFTLNQIISPLVRDLQINSSGTDKYTLINKFIIPMLKYLKFYPFEEVFNILINIFENMLFEVLSNTCKEYKTLIKEVVSGIIIYLNNEKPLLSCKNDELDLISYYINDVLQIYLSNIKLSEYGSNNCSKFGLLSLIKKKISESENFKKLMEKIDYIINTLNINNNNTNNRVQFRLFSHLIISITRKIDSVISPCIIFPIVNLRPIEVFSSCLYNQDFKTSMLYLTLLQSFYGPYSVRFDYSMDLLHHMLLGVNVTNYDTLLRLSDSLIKFILIILKPSTVSLKIPLSKQEDNNSISIVSEYYVSSNSNLNCIMFISKIDCIIEYHFILKLINIEWTDLLIMCEYLDLDFNSWFSHCIQKYKYLWFDDEKNIDSSNYHLSENFKNLVLVIQSKFNFFGINQNTFSLLKEDPHFIQVNQRIHNNLIYFESKSHKVLNSSIKISEFFFYNVVKRFFSAFLSNIKPIPALAIAHACNDIQSVHKVLHDFPNFKMKN
ncbi:hypothetical protein FG386_000182 [Cryptosporidium ryanae]|uniref:uncharacterized protein n=1 Tax=Cryptosporidium ryanae TaxID=515981 RepID=UPI00351A3B36|nr:hypothetical protein FG386_000182 [Cryptosporidium ryanae]